MMVTLTEPDGRPTLPLDAALDLIAVLVNQRAQAREAIIDLIREHPDLEHGLTEVARHLKARV